MGRWGKEGNWELGVGGWGRIGTPFPTQHTVTQKLAQQHFLHCFAEANATALFSPLATPLLGVQATELGTLHSFPTQHSALYTQHS
uniref:Uncharacterized protein n=1 Tax=Desertifilum tharense IPPAS B-1220 TaxID=1781255 RepID=A0ACD5GVR7_9CYAN